MGVIVTLEIRTPAEAIPEIEPVCRACVRADGLCARHESDVLPQIARPGWVRLIGVSLVSPHRQAQIDKPATVSPQRQSYIQRRDIARSTARSKRRGAYGLARKISRRPKVAP